MKQIATIIGMGVLAGSAFAGGVSGSGMIVLDPSASGALTMVGNSSVTIPARAVYVNSTASDCVRTSGSAVLDTPNLYVCGGTRFAGGAMCTGTVTRNPVPCSDPLSGLAIPTSSGQTNRGAASIASGSRTLQPGYYPSGISITGNAQITLSPGVYVFGGDFKLTSGSINGTDVTFVIERGKVDLPGGTSINLAAPKTGDTASVVFAQPVTNTLGFSLAGGSDVEISGAIDVPGGTVSLTGNSSVQGQGPQMGDLIIAKKVSLAGTSLIKIGRPLAPAILPPAPPLFD